MAVQGRGRSAAARQRRPLQWVRHARRRSSRQRSLGLSGHLISRACLIPRPRRV